METILNFAKDYYIVLLIISGILILSLIGYLSETLTSKDIKLKKEEEIPENPVITPPLSNPEQQTVAETQNTINMNNQEI